LPKRKRNPEETLSGVRPVLSRFPPVFAAQPEDKAMGQSGDSKTSNFLTIGKGELPPPCMQDDSKCSVLHLFGFYAFFLAIIGGGVLFGAMLKGLF
jgi:hypothetical protein